MKNLVSISGVSEEVKLLSKFLKLLNESVYINSNNADDILVYKMLIDQELVSAIDMKDLYNMLTLITDSFEYWSNNILSNYNESIEYSSITTGVNDGFMQFHTVVILPVAIDIIEDYLVKEV